MWNGLIKELESSKKKRKKSTKEIVYELGCSRGHFNKVITGERKPGENLIKKLAISLELPEEYITNLVLKGKSEQEVRGKPINIFILVIILTITLISLSIGYFIGKRKPIYLNNKTDEKSPTIIGDSSSFIKDVTIPDGSYISTNTKYKKTWRIKNTGKVPWVNRFLTRITPFDDLVCHSENRVPIPKTLPGHEVDITVNFKSIQLSGSCRTDWKMTDKYGNPFFPNLHGLYSIVNVTSNANEVSESLQ